MFIFFPLQILIIIHKRLQFENMLPPGFENKKTHKYGYFQLQIDLHGIQNIRFLTVQLRILGMATAIKKQIGISDCVAFSFDVGTNLWLFYAYLHDARSLELTIFDDEKKQYKSQIPLVMMASKQVLSNQPKILQNLFQNNSFLFAGSQKSFILNSNKSKIGLIQSTMHLRFFQSINMILFNSGLIQLQDILVIDEISPIVSTIQLPQNQQPAPPKAIQYTEPLKIQAKPDILSISDKNSNFIRTQSLPSMVEYVSHPDDEKQIDDDIERMMSQIYNRPYDSSKYLEMNSEPRKQNINITNYQPLPINNNRLQSKSVEKGIANPPRYPPIMKNNQSRENSYSPYARYSQTTILPTTSMHQTQIVQRQRSLNNIELPKSSRSVEKQRQVDRKKGVFKLKIHQFTMTRMEKQLSLILKIYLNDDNDEFYTINGFRQGEVISFNSSLKIDQKRQISSIKFVLIDSYDMKTIFARGEFDTNRLFTLNPAKGVFIVNLLNCQQSISNSCKIIRVEESNIVPVVPSIKNLRIQVQFEDLIEIVQIYLSLSDFGNICKRVCYKIPFTKQKIQFRANQLNNGKHINLFPHNRSSSNRTTQKIIIQLWQQFQLIGFSEINLKPLSNTNQQIINSSLQPIFLYDEIKQVTDIRNGKSKVSFCLKLYYGTIAQVQNLLNRQERKQKRPQLAKSPIEVESHLGIYIKQSKSKKQAEIQVDNEEFIDKNSISKKSSMLLQQQVLPDEDQDEQWDISKNDSHNQFISQSMQQKLVEHRKTNVIPNYRQKSEDIAKSIDLSKTIKPTNLKSLTKQFQEQISFALSDFAQKKLFDQLKQACKPHLLYNFIQIQKLKHILKDFGMDQLKMDNIIRDILPSSNDMININILYDMVFALILEGDVKEKYIDDIQIGRFCLMVLYKQFHNLEEQFLFEEDTEFDQSRKIYQKIGYKQTMREYNLTHMYIKRVSELQPNRSSTDIRDMLIAHFNRKIIEVQKKQAKKKEIISKIYQEEWDEDDDFFISNINQKQVSQEDTSINHEYSQTHQRENKLKESSQITSIQRDKKAIQQLVRQAYYDESSSDRQPQPNTKDVKITNPTYLKSTSEQLSKSQNPMVNQQARKRTNCRLIIEGFQSCIQTTQCLLNVPLTLAKLKISCRSGGNLSQFEITSKNQNDTYEIQMYLEQTQFVDGSIQLLDSNKIMAKCNVSIMANMRSCYSLKNLQTLQFSGIIKLLLQPFN